MPQFFSSTPVDYGARYIANGWESAGNNIAGAVSRVAADKQEEHLMRVKDSLQARRQKDEADRAFVEALAESGVAPIYNPDGSLNRVSSGAAKVKADEARRVSTDRAIQSSRDAMELDKGMATYGINPKAAMKPNGWSLSPSSVNAPEDPRNQYASLRGAENQGKIDLAAKEAAARAKATDPYQDNYVQGDNYAVNGKSIGRAVRDKRSGKFGFMQEDGSLKPIPEGAEPITPTALQKNVPSYDSFRKVTQDLTDSERSLRQIEQYAKSVGGLEQGISGLADKFTSGIKTLMGENKLTQSELDRRMAEGNLQGLLGGNRTAVVGGGVMTENDAQRIVNYLGGDIGALQNKEQVMQALSQLYRDRYAQYENDILFHNAAVEDYYGSKGYKAREHTDYNPLFGQPATNGSVPQPAATGSKFKVVEIR